MSCGRDEAVCGSRRRRCGREGMDRSGWDEEWVGVGDGSRLLMAHPLVVRVRLMTLGDGEKTRQDKRPARALC